MLARAGGSTRAEGLETVPHSLESYFESPLTPLLRAIRGQRWLKSTSGRGGAWRGCGADSGLLDCSPSQPSAVLSPPVGV